MFHSLGFDNIISSLHESALRITYGNRSSSFKDLLKKGNSVSIHQRNIQALATEIFKVKNNIAPEIMKELFAPKISPYGLRNNNSFKRRRVNSVWYGSLCLPNYFADFIFIYLKTNFSLKKIDNNS